eukprot:COSAG01_NODE_6860_length_3466_cov_4.514108_2_plen_65_part_00
MPVGDGVKKASSFIFADDWQKVLLEQAMVVRTAADLDTVQWNCFHAALDNETLSSAATGMMLSL